MAASETQPPAGPGQGAAGAPAGGDDRTIHFHFDFLSPFGYFASLRVDGLAARHGRRCEWRPMLLGISVLKVMGLPPVADTPLKGAYIRRDAERYARRRGLEVARPFGAPQINPLLPARAVCWLREHSPALARPAAAALYDAHWRRDEDISDPDIAFAALAGAGADTDGVRAGLDSGEAAALLRAEVDASIAAGVFGSPTFRVGGELFWGVEKMETLEEWLAAGGW